MFHMGALFGAFAQVHKQESDGFVKLGELGPTRDIKVLIGSGATIHV
jgi:hypothetical protein